MTTLKFSLKNGMDSMLRVVGLLRRKSYDIKNLNLSENILTIQIEKDITNTVLNNINKLADVVYIA